MTTSLSGNVTKQQEEAIRDVFVTNGWNFENIFQSPNNIQKKQTIPDIPPTPPPSQPENNGNECPDCFLDPCVSSRNHIWLQNRQEPSMHNPPIRRQKYKKFWSCISNLGGWTTERFVVKKRENGNRPFMVFHKREIMPQCVLTEVRRRYPNPPGIPYKGHQWA